MKKLTDMISKMDKLATNTLSSNSANSESSDMDSKTMDMEGLEDYKEIKGKVKELKEDLSSGGRKLARAPVPVRTSDGKRRK